MQAPDLSAELTALCQTLGAVVQYYQDNHATIGPELRERLEATRVPLAPEEPQSYVLLQLLKTLDAHQIVLKVNTHDNPTNSTDLS